MALLVKSLKFLKGIATEINPNTDSLYAKSFIVGGATGTELTQAILNTLTAGSTSDATSLHMHDSRYFQKVETIAISLGSPNAGAPIKTDSRGKIDPSLYQQSDFIHGNLTGLAADDHPQYHNDTRGDARYFKKVEFISSSAGSANAGNPIKTNSQGLVDSTFLNSSFINHEQLSGLLGGASNDHQHLTSAQLTTLTGGSGTDASTLHNHDTRYYTKTQMDASLALKANDNIVIKKDGSVAYTADQSMGSNKLTNLANGVSSTDAVNKYQLDTSASLKVDKAGDTMSGTLDMGSNQVINLADPVNDTDAANKKYVDLTAQGLRSKQAVTVATTDNITLSGLQTIDGYTLVGGERVLVRAQTAASQNGIYIAGSGPWLRASDADTSDKMKPGTTVFVMEGDSLKDVTYSLVTDSPITIDSTDLVFTETSRLGQITAGTGLSKTADTLNVNMGAGIAELPSDSVGVNVYPAGSLQTIDPMTGLQSTATGSQLSILLDGATLTSSLSGLKVTEQGVDTAQLKDSAVTTAKILDQNVTTAKIADSNVTTAKIADQNVTTAKIADQAVTAGKINASVAGAGLTQDNTGALQVNADNDTIEVVSNTVRLKDQGVHRSKIENLAVDTTKIDFGLTETKVNASSVPIVNAQSKFTGSTVEAALNELGEAALISTATSGEAIGVGSLVCMRRDSTGTPYIYNASADASDNYVSATATIGDLTFTSTVPAGNDIRVILVNPGVVSAALSVSVSNQDVTVSLATDGTGSLISTADQIANAVAVSAAAAPVVLASVSGTGANIQSAASFTSLAGGYDFNDNGRWEVYGMALTSATSSGTSVLVKKIGRLACTFVTPPTASQIGRTVYLSVNRGQAVVGTAPTTSMSGIVSIGRLVSLTEVEFRAAVLRGVNG